MRCVALCWRRDLALLPEGGGGGEGPARGARESARLGLPDGFKAFSPFPFSGVDQQAARTAIGNQEFYWRENFAKVGPGYLRAMGDVGASIYTAATGRTIVSFYFFSLGGINLYNLVAVFLDDGTAYQVNLLNANSVAAISTTPGTFYQSGAASLPACVQWGTQYLLIANNFKANCYYAWDGTLLYQAGSLAPTSNITYSGANYTSAPAVTAYGGNGSGATFTATVANGAVTNVVVTNPGSGYQNGDQVQLWFSGGGSDNTPLLTPVMSPGASVANATVTNGGSGYTAGTFPIAIVGGGGSGATGTYTVASGGSVTSVQFANGGSGYTSPPTLGFLGVVLSVSVTNAGSGYAAGTYALGFSGGGGAGAAGTYTIGGGGAVTSLTLTSVGAGYTSAPAVSFPSGGGTGAAATSAITGGTGAAATPILLGGEVVSSITITHGGTNLTGTPTLSFSGGGGSGTTAVCTISGGAINSVTVTNPGSGYSSPPLITLSSENNAAQATMDLMPTGISGSILETFQSRVWLATPYQSGNINNDGVFLVSAPESFTDFATSDGGLIYVSSDPYLRNKYVSLKQTNGYLYPLGDSSVSIVSNVQTNSNTNSTTNVTTVSTSFNYQNTDPQIGCGWRDTVQALGRTLIFANHDGVYGLYGGAVDKLSEKICRLFDGAVFPLNAQGAPVAGALTPSAAVCMLHELKLYLLLMTITDPFTGNQRRVLLCWDSKEWSIASQSPNITFIGTQEAYSNILAWGTDGTKLFQLFATPSSTLTKRLSTKLYGAEELFITKMSYGFYTQLSDMATPANGVTLTLTIDNEDQSYPVPASPATIESPAPQATVWGVRSGDIPGQMLGCTLTSTSPDFVLMQALIGYYDQAALA